MKLVGIVRGSKVIIDWHNLGYSILGLKLGSGHLLVRFAKRCALIHITELHVIILISGLKGCLVIRRMLTYLLLAQCEIFLRRNGIYSKRFPVSLLFITLFTLKSGAIRLCCTIDHRDVFVVVRLRKYMKYFALFDSRHFCQCSHPTAFL